MIIQGSNIPIIFTFPADMSEIKDIEISLHNMIKEYKHWDKDDVIIEDKKIIAPFTQAESILFPSGQCYIEIKWLDKNGITNFAKNLKNTVVERYDKTIMEGETDPNLGGGSSEHNCGCGCCVSVSTTQIFKVDSITETIIEKGYSPYINEETGTWFEYDEKTKQFVDTEVQAGLDPIPLETILAYWEASVKEEED